MEEGNGKLEKRAVTYAHLFVNRRDDRIWLVEKLPTDQRKPLEGVQIVQQDAGDRITDKLYAKSAEFDPDAHRWTFTGARVAHYSPEGDVAAVSYPDKHVIDGWSETPWRIHSSLLEADKLSVPEPHQYLSLNSDFTPVQLAPFRTYLDYRWALPWTCLVVVMFTAPLAIVYQRRGVLAGVAGSILIFFLILFLGNLFLALGRGERIGVVVGGVDAEPDLWVRGSRAGARARAQPRPPAADPGGDVGLSDGVRRQMQKSKCKMQKSEFRRCAELAF